MSLVVPCEVVDAFEAACAAGGGAVEAGQSRISLVAVEMMRRREVQYRWNRCACGATG